MLNKKGIYSLSLFSLLLILYFTILGISYYKYDLGIDDYSKLVMEEENIISMNSLRNHIVKVISLENVSIPYENKIDDSSIAILVNSTYIYVKNSENLYVIQSNFSTYGVEFCDNYTIIPQIKSNYLFNGTCVSKN